MIAEMVEIKTLGEVYDVRDGTHDSPKYHDQGYALITSKNLKPDGLNKENVKFISEEDFRKINERSQVHAGDILFAMIGTIGNPIVVEETPDFAIKNVALIKVGKQQNSKYLRYYLLSDYVVSKMQNEAKGTTQRFVGLGYLRSFPIPIPPLPEQERIVAKLDAAFTAIDQAKANVERNLQNAKELFQSKLNEVFSASTSSATAQPDPEPVEGWVEQKLGELITVKHGFAFKSKYFTTEGDHVLLTPGNYFEEGGYRDRGEKQKYYIGEIPDGFLLNKGDLLVAMTEQAPGLLGSPLLVPEDNKFLHNQRLGLVQVLEGVDLSNEFLFHLFNTKHLRDSVFESGSGVKVRHTSPKKIYDVSVSVTLDPEKQKEAVSMLDEIKEQTNQLQTHYTQKLTELEELKKSLLERAFKGEI